MAPAKHKSPPEFIYCPCGKKEARKKARLTIIMAKTTYDGRYCPSCGRAVITCHWCHGVVCDWKQGKPNSELAYIPKTCPNCGVLINLGAIK